MKYLFALLLICCNTAALANITDNNGDQKNTPSTSQSTNNSTADEDAEDLTQAFDGATYDSFKNKDQGQAQPGQWKK